VIKLYKRIIKSSPTAAINLIPIQEEEQNMAGLSKALNGMND